MWVQAPLHLLHVLGCISQHSFRFPELDVSLTGGEEAPSVMEDKGTPPSLRLPHMERRQTQTLPPGPSRGLCTTGHLCFLFLLPLQPIYCLLLIHFSGWDGMGVCVCVCVFKFFASSKHSSLNGFDKEAMSSTHAWRPVPPSEACVCPRQPASQGGDAHGPDIHSSAVLPF